MMWLGKLPRPVAKVYALTAPEVAPVELVAVEALALVVEASF